MLIAGGWRLNQQNEINFPLVDSNGASVSGLGSTFTLRIRKAGGSFAASAGTKAETGEGGYRYVNAASEADTVGPVFIKITGSGIVEQWLEYVVEQRTINAVEFTYTVTDSTTLLPVEGVQVWFATDSAGANVVWAGVSDALGVARDSNGYLPRLDPGTYYVYRQKAGFIASNPDTEVVS